MLLLLALLAVTTVDINPKEILNTFDPRDALGAAVDGHEEGTAEQVYTPKNLAAMKAAGLHSLTYRLRTELGCEAWHWNPEGSWSEAGKSQGYWTSTSAPGKRIDVSWGYRLPRRGNTIDQANNDGYSRIDDGDPATFWKSNPYLDPGFSHDTLALDQWVVVDLQAHAKVNAVRIAWANPYAVSYRIQFWAGKDPADGIQPVRGAWVTFEGGDIRDGRGGIKLAHFGAGASVRFLRIQLRVSSHTAESRDSRDPRDRMGFAIRELEIGRVERGAFVDAVKHRSDKQQTPVYTSSTDPWHREIDRDPRTEQPGFDRVYGSGLTNDRPVLIPVATLYATPEDVEAEVRWLRARHYSVRGIELGEEPDGQYADAEAYASLYCLMTRAVRRVMPGVPCGGPSFQTLAEDEAAWPDPTRRGTWLGRFLTALKARRSEREFGFFSFEWYPAEDHSDSVESKLQNASQDLEDAMSRAVKSGLRRDVPWFLTEYGYSAFTDPVEEQIPAGLLNLDIVGEFLTLGGRAAYLYGYEPNELIEESSGQWGNLAMWLKDSEHNAKYPLSIFWTANLMTTKWCSPLGGRHELLKTVSSDSDTIAAYTVRRPSGSVAVLLLNKSATASREIDLRLAERSIASGTLYQWDKRQYKWQSAGANGHPTRSDPPIRLPLRGRLVLPPYSATVVVIGG